MSLQNAFSGAVASCTANTLVYPLDLVKTVLQTQDKEDVKYNDTFDCMLKLYQKDGLAALYRGYSVTMIHSFIQSFCYFFWYSSVRRQYSALCKKPSKANSTIEELALGIVAASVSQLFTSPIGVVSTAQQTGDGDGTIATAKKIYEKDGITGFWRGLKVSLVLTTNPSITYASYERLKNVFLNKTRPSAMENFVLGVVSKIVATMITQPLIISKVSLQSAGSKYKRFQDVLVHILKTEGVAGLWRGVLPQLSKGVLVQGLLFMFKGEISDIVNRIIMIVRIILAQRKMKAARLAKP